MTDVVNTPKNKKLDNTHYSESLKKGKWLLKKELSKSLRHQSTSSGIFYLISKFRIYRKIHFYITKTNN